MSSEDLKSLIVTDPDIVDEGIDISGLRTQTDTDPRLLASIADFPGISYDPTEFSYLSDLNELFGYGLPLVDTEAATPPATGTPETGGGGAGSGSGGGGGSGPTNTAEEQRLIDAGIGVQLEPGSPISSPYEGMPPTQDELVEFNLRPVNTDFRNQQLVNQGIGLRVGDTGPVFAPGEIPVTQADLDRENRTPGSNVIPTDPSQMLPQISTDSFMVPGALGVDPREKMDFVTEEDAADPTFLDRIGLGQFNPAEAFVKAAINKVVGLPISFLIDALAENLPPQDPRKTALNEFYTTGAGAQYMDPSSPNYIPGMEDYNRISGGFLNTITGGAYGDPTTYGLQGAYEKRSDNISETLQDKYGLTDAEVASVKAGIITDAIKDKAYNETLGKTTNLLEDLSNIEKAKEAEKKKLDLFLGDIDERDQMLEDLITDYADPGVDAEENQPDGDGPGSGPGPSGPTGDYESAGVGGPAGQGSPQSTGPTDKGGGADAGTGSFGNENVGGSPTGTGGPPSQGGSAGGPPSQGGGGGNGGNNNGKIVCTMMNESYGFGSFRNKIWMKFHKDLSPEYQKGYHKLFLPLVKIAKTNKVVKKILEHIAVHSTIDMRQATRGKTHLLGRIYRKILLPICYWVGKYAKR